MCVFQHLCLYSNIWAVYVQDAGNAFASLLGFDMKCLCCWVWQGVHHIFWNFHIWGSVYFISMNCWWYIGCMNLWRSSYIPWIFHISGTAYFISMYCRWYIGWLAATGSALAGTSAAAMGGPRNLHTFVCCLKGNKFRFATQGCKSKQSKSFIFETFKCYLHEWNSWCYYMQQVITYNPAWFKNIPSIYWYCCKTNLHDSLRYMVILSYAGMANRV